MPRRLAPLSALLAGILAPALAAAPPVQAHPSAAVGRVLDDWHLAAAQADEARYFGHLDERAVFLGTDATERWGKEAFRTFAHPFFARGAAWSFRATRRAVTFASPTVALFDEDLETSTLGPCRGSGVLECRDGLWRILQYNLSMPIPNPLVKEVRARIAAHLQARP
jgi:hypothetical protein